MMKSLIFVISIIAAGQSFANDNYNPTAKTIKYSYLKSTYMEIVDSWLELGSIHWGEHWDVAFEVPANVAKHKDFPAPTARMNISNSLNSKPEFKRDGFEITFLDIVPEPSHFEVIVAIMEEYRKNGWDIQ